MNRRGFLKFIGAAAILGLSAPRALGLTVDRTAQLWELYDGTTEPEVLRAAIERLFPAGVMPHSIKAFEEFVSVPLGLTVMDERADYKAVTYRATHQTFALGYVPHPDPEKNARMHRALYQTMWNTWVMMASRPENAGAKLMWRSAPAESDGYRFFGDDKTIVLRMRASLVPQGWRSRMFVAPKYFGVKAEGAPVEML